MNFQAGRVYRAKTAGGEHVTFRVIDASDSDWPTVDLESSDGPEQGVSLNKNQLLWVSSEGERGDALSAATEAVIESLERNAEEPPPRA